MHFGRAADGRHAGRSGSVHGIVFGSIAVHPRIPPSVSLDDRHDPRERTSTAHGLSDGSRRSSSHGRLRRGWERVGARPAERRRDLSLPRAGPRAVHVEPARRSRAPERPGDLVDRRTAAAGWIVVFTRGDVVGASGRRGRRLRLSQRHAPAQDLSRDAAPRRHHTDPWRSLLERHLPPIGARDRVRRRYRRAPRDLALVERG